MLTNSDRKYLEHQTSKQGRRWQGALIGVSVLVVFQSFFHFLVAFWIGRANEYSFFNLLLYWSRGIGYEKLYPGYIIHAFGQLEVGIAYLALALVMAVFAWAYQRQRAREQRVVETLKNAGCGK